jgi:hypothetical protein
MATFRFGNNDNRTVDVTTNNDTYIVKNGDNDQVFAQNSNYDTIILGTSDVGPHIGNNDSVNADNSSFDTIVLGVGAGNVVSAVNSSHDVITLGDGAGDMATVGGDHNTVTLGDGDHDLANLNDVVRVRLSSATVSVTGWQLASITRQSPSATAQVTRCLLNPPIPCLKPSITLTIQSLSAMALMIWCKSVATL